MCLYAHRGSVKMNTSNISNYKPKDFALLKKLKNNLFENREVFLESMKI